MILACGTGKTLTALFVNEKRAADRTLVLVPSLSLLAQTLREWTATPIWGSTSLGCVRTRPSPNRRGGGEHRPGLPVTTTAEEIAAFLCPRPPNSRPTSARSPPPKGWGSAPVTGVE